MSDASDQAFNDGSEVEIVCAEDEPPRSGVMLDPEHLLVTEEEEAAGQFLGLAIDVDDDSDDGSQWGTVDNPTMTAEDFEVLGGDS